MNTKLNYSTPTLASAPENSKAALEQLERAFGVIPNIAGAIANLPLDEAFRPYIWRN